MRKRTTVNYALQYVFDILWASIKKICILRAQFVVFYSANFVDLKRAMT